MVHNRYARCPMASPNAKYSQSASTVTTAVAIATTHVGVNSTKPTTTGINTSAVATRFQVIQTVLTGRPRHPSQIDSGFPTELYRHSSLVACCTGTLASPERSRRACALILLGAFS